VVAESFAALATHFLLQGQDDMALWAELGIPIGTAVRGMELDLTEWIAEDWRFDGYRMMLVCSEVADPPGEMPWKSIQLKGQEECYRLWVWRLRYRDAPVYGELRFITAHDIWRGMGVPDMAARPGDDEWLRASKGLDLVLKRLSWGHPYGTRYEWLETKEACEKQVLTAMRDCQGPIRYRTVTPLLGISERHLRDGLQKLGLNWPTLRQQAQQRRSSR
jgi:hypothetical protein